MKQLFYILILVTQIQNLFAQDTLILHSGQKKVVHVLEISPVDVKYKRYGTETPLYVLNINEIFCIKYPNGIIDTLTKTPPKEIRNETQKLHIVDSRIFNSKGPLTDARLQKLIYNYPVSPVKDQLLFKYKYLGRQEKIQLFSILAGLGTGYLGLNVYAAAGRSVTRISVAVAGTALIGTSIYFFVKAQRKVKRTKRELVDMYNENL